MLEEVKSPCNGLVFTLREYPVVNPGSLVARVLDVEHEETGEVVKFSDAQTINRAGEER